VTHLVSSMPPLPTSPGAPGAEKDKARRDKDELHPRFFGAFGMCESFTFPARVLR
jgi:hypothetical protein